MASNLLSIDMITRDAIELFKNSNKFLMNCDEQYSEYFDVEELEPEIQLSTKEVIVLGAAAVIAKNPVVSRRFLDWFK